MKIRNAMIAAITVLGALVVGASPAAAQPSAAASAKSGISSYWVTFRTGDINNAGTEDAVRLTTFGSLNQSPPIQIDRDFNHGETVTFGPYKWPSLGIIDYISLGKSGREKDAWYPEWVEIQDEAAGIVYHCGVGEWFPQSSVTRFYGCTPVS